MSGYNNSLLYYKHYYADSRIRWEERSDADKERNKAVFKEQNDLLYGAVFPTQTLFLYPEGLTRIALRTTYPGLLLGSGIAHGSGLMGEMKLGFYFDHTTGLPVIPGSSVKGVLRSAFPQGYRKAAAKGKKSDEEKAALLEKAEQTSVYLQYHLHEITQRDWEASEMDALETFLFGSYQTGTSDTPMSGRPVFHDAIPVNADLVQINGEATLTYLGDDFITPHNKKKGTIPAALRNPVPIAFVKVLPGVTFQFQFALLPFLSKSAEVLLDTGQIQKLFAAILLDFGIGAKTNTGYGRLKPAPQKKVKSGTATSAPPREHKFKKPFSAGQTVIGKIAVSKKSGNKLVVININDVDEKFPCADLDNFEEGHWIQIEVLKASISGGIAEVGNPKPV
jgi:CRISPR-associated protein Cmr6